MGEILAVIFMILLVVFFYYFVSMMNTVLDFHHSIGKPPLITNIEYSNNFGIKNFIISLKRYPIHYYYSDGVQKLEIEDMMRGHTYILSLTDSGCFNSNFKCSDTDRDIYVNEVFPVFKEHNTPSGFGINTEKWREKDINS